MGKKKSKVKWTAVDGLPINYGSDSGLINQKQDFGDRKTFTANTTLPPRFERKAAEEKNLVYYNGQFCEAEDLPNGFVKVRSKHLDILFKRDFYTKKIERIFKQSSKQPKGNAISALLSETKEEMLPYTGHNSLDGSIIYNIDHLLASSNISFECSTNATANPSENVSMENGDINENISMAVNNICMDANNVSEIVADHDIYAIPHFQEMENPEDPRFEDNYGDRMRNDSGFVDSSMNLPSDNTFAAPPVENSFFPSTPSVCVYIPLGNTLIHCKEVVVPHPAPRDPRCTCDPSTSIFLAGQGNPEPVQIVHHAPTGDTFISGSHPFDIGNPQNNTFFNRQYYNIDMILSDYDRQMLSNAPFVPNHPLNPHPHVQPILPPSQYEYHQQDYPLFSSILEDEETNPHFDHCIDHFAPVVEDFIPNPGDVNGPLSTSEPSSLTNPETYQLFSANEKIHPVFGLARNDVIQAYDNQDEDLPRKVIEPDYDWVAQQEEFMQEIRYNLLNQSTKSTPWKDGSKFKHEISIPQIDAPQFKSSIPGLSLETLTPKKTQKKKRRKRKGANEMKSQYSIDETLAVVEAKTTSDVLQKTKVISYGNEGCPSQTGSDIDSDKLESLFEARSMEQSHEIELSDALASSLVDPLTHLMFDGVEKSVQEIIVVSMADIIFDVVDKNNVHEVLNEIEQDVLKENNSRLESNVYLDVELAKSNKMTDQVSDITLISVVGSAVDPTDEITMIIEELITASLKSDSRKFVENIDSQGNSNVNDLEVNQISSVLEVEMEPSINSKEEIPTTKSYRKVNKSKANSRINSELGREDIKANPKASKHDGFDCKKPINGRKASYSDELHGLRESKLIEAPNPKNSVKTTKVKTFKVSSRGQTGLRNATSVSKENENKARKSKPHIQGSDQNKTCLLEETYKAGNEDCLEKENVENNYEIGSKIIPKERRNKKSGKKAKMKAEPVHKVMIDDSELHIVVPTRVLGAAEVVTPKQIKLIQTTSNNIFVSNLGLGIERGCMTLGRLSSQFVPSKERIG